MRTVDKQLENKIGAKEEKQQLRYLLSRRTQLLVQLIINHYRNFVCANFAIALDSEQ